MPQFARRRSVSKSIIPANDAAEPFAIIFEYPVVNLVSTNGKLRPRKKTLGSGPEALLVKIGRYILESKSRRGSEWGGGLNPVVVGRESYRTDWCASRVRMPQSSFGL